MKSRLWSTKFLLNCVAIAVGVAVINAPINLWSVAMSSALPFVYAALTGFWIIGSVLALDLLRTPGASLLTQFVVGLLMIPFGGPVIVVTYVMIGGLYELPFLATLYRNWNRAFYYGFSVIFTSLYGWSTYAYFALGVYPPALQITFFALLIVSGAFFTWLSLLISAKLRARGLGSRIARSSAPPAPRTAPPPDAPLQEEGPRG